MQFIYLYNVGQTERPCQTPKQTVKYATITKKVRYDINVNLLLKSITKH